MLILGNVEIFEAHLGTLAFFQTLIGWLKQNHPKKKEIPSLQPTCPLKIDPCKRRFLLETIIFMGYVSFREAMPF